MWLAIDIGGTKTLLAVFNKDGEVREHVKFPTNHEYSLFLSELKTTLANLQHKDFDLAAVASPGRIDYDKGVGLAYGNLPWKNVPLRETLHDLLGCPVLIENDAKLAALSEARHLGRGKYPKTLYITISTGIGGGLITNGIIDPFLADAEIGKMVLEHDGEMQEWEHFASGSAVVRRFGKMASEIEDPAIWKLIARDISVGLIDVLAAYQPDIVILGGPVGGHLARYHPYLVHFLKEYASPLVSIPPIVQAHNPEQAVIYGGYELMKDHARHRDKKGLI